MIPNENTHSPTLECPLGNLAAGELADLATALADAANDARARLRRQRPRPHDRRTRDYLDSLAAGFAEELQRRDRLAFEVGR